MTVKVKFEAPGFANCDIRIRAKGSIAVTLYWADKTAPLRDWSSIAVVPIDPAGNGSFRFEGHRSIPPEVTHIYAKAISQDFTTIEEAFTEIPNENRIISKSAKPLIAFSIMSDLHLSGKPGKISKALRMASAQTILITGDLTNDGFTEQFAAFKQCIEENVSDKLVLSVTGNHDQLLKPDPQTLTAYEGYDSFQQFLFDRAAKTGYTIETDASGAYSVQLDKIDVIGLQCVSYYRKFTFSEGEQLKWLEKHLDKHYSDRWHIIMCHAPLLAHNPHRNIGDAYLGRDSELQKIIDNHRNIIFVSGHTHFSPNVKQGCIEFQHDNQILYINAGSVTPTELGGEVLMPSEWKDGVIMELLIFPDAVEIKSESIHKGIFYPRGYYRFDLPT